MWFAQRVRTGVVNINVGTFGSEPHMPFGGFGSSGNGTREPGVEALLRVVAVRKTAEGLPALSIAVGYSEPPRPLWLRLEHNLVQGRRAVARL